MYFHFTPIAIAYLLNSSLAVAVVWQLWQKRQARGARLLALMMIAVAIWTLTNGLEAATVELSAKIFWSQVSYLGITSSPVLFLWFSLEYTQKIKWLSPRRMAPFWIMPIITTGLAFTNERHHLIWNRYTPSPTHDNVIIYGHGLWFWIFIAYTYSLIVIATILLIWDAIRYRNIYRRQSITMLIGVFIPFFFNILYVLGPTSLTQGFDITPLAFTVTGIILTVGIYRLHLFDLMPLARDTLIEIMEDGMIVLDEQDRILDINAAAKRLLKVTDQPLIGDSIYRLLLPESAWEAINLQSHGEQTEIFLSSQPPQYLNVKVSHFKSEPGHLTGRLIVITDITQQKQMEIFATEQRTLAEALRNSAAMLSNTLELDQVLEGVMQVLKQAIPHDLIYIQLVNESGWAYTVCSRGFTDKNFESAIQKIRLPVKDTHNLRYMRDSGNPIIINDIQSSENWIAVEGDAFIRSYLGAPMRVKEKLIGFINLIGLKPNMFTSSHTEQLASVANQAGIAIENAHLYSTIQQYAREQSILNEIIRNVSSKLAIKELAEQVYLQINRFIETQSFLIATYEPGAEGWQTVFLKMGNEVLENIKAKLSQGFTGYVIQSGQSIFLDNVTRVAEFYQQSGRASLLATPKTFMAVPLIASGEVIGAMAAQNNEKENAFTEQDFALFTRIGAQIAIAFENARLFAKMEQLATTDALTNIYNRRHFFLLGESEFERAVRYHKPLAMIMLDLDHFKKVNDHYGHRAGDHVLQVVANLCRHSLRRIDILGRYGGEEFTIVLPESGLREAEAAAERLRQEIASTDIVINDEVLRITASFGVTEIRSEVDTFEAMIERTDRAMYLAKENGRNLVEVF